MIASDVQRLEQDAIVTVFELDARQYGDGILRFAPEPIDGGPVRLNGYEYQPVPIAAEGFEWNGQGTLPRPTLSITAMELAFLSLVISADDLVGAPVKRIRTYRKHLDDGSDPDPEAMFPVDYYVIERKTSQNRRAIQFELSVQLDQQGRMIPHRQVLRDTCGYRYRYSANGQYHYDGVGCPYAGDGEWEVDGTPAPPGKDKCGKRLSDCKLRFGQHAVLPFNAFPGVGRVR
ncbi:MAG: phage minor tail protein L [Pseudomonadota bacterium]|nr:phage minor tail protein L [Pseudomonadota bacterium]